MKYIAVIPAFLALVGLIGVSNSSAEDSTDFSRDILPLLAENCFACHGFDAEAREAGLRLDTREGATGGDSGHGVIVAGDAGASELVERLRADDPDVVMPPPETGKSLTLNEKQQIIDWINSGASYDSHLSLIHI